MRQRLHVFCPQCRKKTGVRHIVKKEDEEVRGEHFNVTCDYLKCTRCHTEFVYGKICTHDPLDEAYRKYRDKHGMLQPEEIKAIRTKYSLTQGQLAGLLGFGKVTLSRYERGALQDEVHDRMLRLAQHPGNIVLLCSHYRDTFSPEQRKKIEQSIQKTCLAKSHQ